MSVLHQYKNGMDRVLAALEPSVENYNVCESRLSVVKNVQTAMHESGYEISLSQAEEIWGLYSFDKYASWLVGGENVESALNAIRDLCDSIENGENHVGL